MDQLEIIMLIRDMLPKLSYEGLTVLEDTIKIHKVLMTGISPSSAPGKPFDLPGRTPLQALQDIVDTVAKMKETNSRSLGVICAEECQAIAQRALADAERNK